KDIVAMLNATMSRLLADPQAKQRFAELGIQISALDQQAPEALRAYQKAEAARWWPIIKAAHIKGEGRSKLFRPAPRNDRLRGNPLQLLQAPRPPDLRRHRLVRKARLPVGDTDLANIDVAARVQSEAVWREELAGFDTWSLLAAEPRDARAPCID